ncbi:claspin-like [Saccostrea echinata]|uniref:claspin-like n=1 Tax=Saccostrea echinata TaxID=191078 RepID=UPI002A7FC28B|nr:claspin-like [Saccostrea echinata]
MTVETTEVNATQIEVKKSLKEDAHSNEKVDSGMDDDSQQSNEQDMHLSDEEGNDLLIGRKSKQSNRILDDDEEECMERGGETTIEEKESKRTESDSPSVTDEALSKAFESGSENDSDEEGMTLSVVKKKKRIASFDEDSNHSTKEGEQKDDSEHAGEIKSTLFANSDLFDAENDEENSQGVNNSVSDKEDNSESDSGDNSDSSREGNEDEGFDESCLDPKLLAKLKKGAAKKPTRKSKEKSRKDELLDIHSETQRIVRESRVNLPYHQPEPKPLSAFLARASRKQELYKSLHNTRDIHKARIMQQTFEKDKTSKQSEGDKTLQGTSEKISEIKATEESEKIEKDTEEIISVNENVSEDINEKHSSSEVQLGDIDLPDLEEREKEVEERLGQKDSPQPVKAQSKLAHIDKEVANCESSVESEGAISNTQCADSIKSIEKQSAKSKLEEHASEARTEHTITHESKLSFLLEPDLPHMSAIPKLSGGPDAVISLDKEEEEEPQNPGVRKLMGRFMDHCKKRMKHVNKDVDIRIVEKDKDELHMKTFTYHPTQEDENSLQAMDVPGAKLMALKEKLQEKMKVKREESRKQRQDVYDLDNEEGYTAEDEDAILDDDDEMSEHSDTDVEDDEFDEEFGEDEEMEVEERDKERNPFADDEAEEDDGDEEEGCESDEDGDNLKLHLSDEEEEDNVGDKTGEEDEKDQAVQIKSSAKIKKPRVLQISDDEESRDVSEEQEKASEVGQSGPDPTEEKAQENKIDDEKGLFKEPLDDMFVPFSKHGSLATQAQELKRTSSLIPPVEDSQDLYGTLPAIPSTCMDSQQSQTLNFYIEESQSRMFDNDGFLRTGSTAKKPKSKPFMSFDMDSSQENYDELLDLCSGRFQEGDKKGTCKQQLFGTQTDTQNNMEQLMGLCSGKFIESQVDVGKSQKTGVKRKSPVDEEEDSSDSFKLVSDNEEEDENNGKNVFSDDERIEEEEGSRDSEGPQQDKFKGFTIANKHGKIRREFVEAEAELSGSEYDSDENLDLAEEDDILEMEEGDKDEVGTEEELRNQVGRAHLKQVIDEDKRELIRYQEMYLPDGDLHSEGQGRIRRFKWSNIDEGTQQDMFNNDSDGENMEEEDQEVKWRQERYEREKFLQEQEEKERNEEENSQFLKFGKVFLKRSISETGAVKKASSEKLINTENGTQMTASTIFKSAMQKKGSFLGRNKETLAKIAELTKTTVNPTGPRNSRNFVFQVISPDKDTNKQNAVSGPTQGKVRKAHLPKQHQPAAKKPRLEKSLSFPQNSIFNHM